LLYALVFVFGVIIGSFLNVCIVRIPKNQSIVFSGSKCVSCGKGLSAIDLVPLLSFLWLRGKCRRCGALVSWRYFVVELLTGLVFVMLYTRFGFEWRTVIHFILSSILIVASFIDYEHRIIPNGLIIAGITAALPANVFGMNISFLDGVYGFIAGGGILGVIALISLLLLKKEGMGGGDIKLMAMTGFFVGWEITLLSLILAVYMAAIVILLLIAFKVLKRGDHIPFGPFLSIGIIISLLFSEDIIYWYISTLMQQ